MTLSFHGWSFHPIFLPSHRKSTIAPKKASPYFRSSIRTRSHTTTGNQKAKQAIVSATEFNEMNELRSLTHMMSYDDESIWESTSSPQSPNIQGPLKLPRRKKHPMSKRKTYISHPSSISHNLHLHLHFLSLTIPKSHNMKKKFSLQHIRKLKTKSTSLRGNSNKLRELIH